MIEPYLVLAALYRWSLVYFAERAMTILEPATPLTMNWHHRAIAYQLERCFRGENRRLIISQPPKTLKTHLVSVAFVAWLLMQDPSLRIAIICYDEALASTQLRKIRQLLKSRWFRWLAPGTRIRRDKDTETLIETTAGGEIRALSVQGGITGHGFDYMIIDDPQKASLARSETERRNLEELYSSSIANRWRNPAKGVLIVVMQRLHVDDFTAYLLRVRYDTVHLSIPAIAPCDMRFEIGHDVVYEFAEGELLEPDRLSESFLDEMRALQGEAHFAAQYMQAPIASGARPVDPGWFRRFTEPRQRDFRVISIDPAFTENAGNFSAALVCDLVGEDVELAHGEQVQVDYPGLLRWIRQLEKRWKPDLFLIEAIGAGQAISHWLKELDICHVATVGTQGKSKLHRMEMVSPIIEQGHVWLPADAEWARRFLRDMAEFPDGASDDWPDALSQLLLYPKDVRREARMHRERRCPTALPPRRGPWLPRGIHYQRWELN